jgi:hypothetical protein
MCFARVGEASLLIPAGDGAFIAELLAGHDLDIGDKHILHLQARTWLSADQPYEDQRPDHD